MMGRQTGDQSQLFYLFNLERRIPASHLLRRINPVVTRILIELRDRLAAFYSDIGRPSIDPELMIRMLIVGYCYGIRFERQLCEELELHLAYRWFCRLDLDDKVPDHSTFSVNRHGRFRDSDILRQVFEAVVRACMDAGLVKGDGFAVDASVMEANASRYHGKTPDEIAWAEPDRQTRAVKEYLAGLDGDAQPNPDRKPPKLISPSDPCSAWTAKANKRVQFGYGLNYLIDIANAIIVDVEPTPARTYDEVESTKTMLDRTEQRLGLKPKRLAHFARLPTESIDRRLLSQRARCGGCQAAAVLRSLHGRHSHPRADSLATARRGEGRQLDVGDAQAGNFARPLLRL
jgi:transposase